MAKKAKKQGFSLTGFDLSHYQQIESYVQAVDRLYNQAVNEYAQLAVKTNIDPDKLFKFADYPQTRKTAQAIADDLASNMKSVIVQGSVSQWNYACQKSDAFLESILDTSKLKKKTLAKFQDRNLDALKAFQGRKVNGFDLSDRIWRYTGQLKSTMELGIDVGIGSGKSAQQLSKDLRKFLIEPDNLFRRVRDKHGNLQLSKSAQAFHPGQGVYRSSYKNAMRLTRSEINMAYRESDLLRWEKLDFIVGYEVKLSNNHTLNGVPFVDICDDLVGKYPKEFKFKGWHPQCRCQSFPILMDPNEFDTDELNELKAALDGTEYNKYDSANKVSDVPKGFKDWVSDNAERSQNWASQPYFIKDNFVGGKIDGGLKFATQTQAKAVVSVPKAVEPKFVSSKNIKEAEQWALDNLNIKYVNFKGLDIDVANDINQSIFNIKQVMPNIKTNGIGNAQESNKAIKQFITTEIRKSDWYIRNRDIFGERTVEYNLKKLANGSVSNVGSSTVAWSTNINKINIPGNGGVLDLSKFKGVYINQKYGKSAKYINDIVIENSNSGFYTKGAKDFGYIMSHEIGHEIDKTIGFANTNVFKEIYAREHAKGIQNVIENLSKYGATAGGRASHKPAEMIAEAWAEFISSPNPRPLAKEIGEAMLKQYHEVYIKSTGVNYTDWKEQNIKKILK